MSELTAVYATLESGLDSGDLQPLRPTYLFQIAVEESFDLSPKCETFLLQVARVRGHIYRASFVCTLRMKLPSFYRRGFGHG